MPCSTVIRKKRAEREKGGVGGERDNTERRTEIDAEVVRGRIKIKNGLNIDGCR